MSEARNKSASTMMMNANAQHNANMHTQLFVDYTDELLNFATITCILFMIIGVPSNLLTIIALLRGKHTRNATAVFIVNLSLSDLLFGCFNLPLAASTFMRRAWIHSVMLCRLFPLLRYGLLAVSLVTVSLITINRYVIIAHPRQYPRIYQRKYLTLMVTATWLAAFSIMIPTWRGIWGEFGLDVSIGSCSILPDKYGRSPKEFLFVIAFMLPCLCIVFCYARIFYVVRRAACRTRDPTLSKSCSFLDQQKPNVTTTTTAPAPVTLSAALTTKKSTAVATATAAAAKAERKAAKSGKRQQRGKCDNYKSIGAAAAIVGAAVDGGGGGDGDDDDGDDDDDVYEDGMRPFFIDEDIEYIDVSDTNDDNTNTNTSTTSTRAQYAPMLHASSMPQLGNNCKQLNGVVDQHATTRSNARHMPSTKHHDDNDVDDDDDDERTNLSEKLTSPHSRTNAIANTLKTSFNRFNPRKTHYVSMGGNTSNASSLYPGKMSQKDRRLLKMIFVIFVSFVICYLPITITKTFKSLKHRHVLNISGYLLIYLTTCINPLIYVLMSSEYRQAYWSLLNCQPVEQKKNDYKRKAKP